MAWRPLLFYTNRSMSLEYWYLMEIVGLDHGRTLSRRWMSTSRFLAALTWVLSKQFTKMCRSGIFITTLVISLIRLINSFLVRSIIKIFFTGNKKMRKKCICRLQNSLCISGGMILAYKSVKIIIKKQLAIIWVTYDITRYMQNVTLQDICNDNENVQRSIHHNSSCHLFSSVNIMLNTLMDKRLSLSLVANN